MTQTSTARRLGTVSGGALLLCLSFGGTALAATTPAAGGDDPVGTITKTVAGALPTPTPIATPSQLAPVEKTVRQVAQTAGVPVPSSTPTAAPAPLPSGGKNTTGRPARHLGGGTSKPAQHSVLGSSHTRVQAPTVMPAGGINLGGLRGEAPAFVAPVTDPVIAPQQTAVLAAGQAPALAPQPHGVLPGSGDDRAPRGLFIALATMVIGALAAGHVKVVQDRLSGVTTG